MIQIPPFDGVISRTREYGVETSYKVGIVRDFDECYESLMCVWYNGRHFERFFISVFVDPSPNDQFSISASSDNDSLRYVDAIDFSSVLLGQFESG